ncbi:uncharacterized protein LOC122342412 [Puntigrus tetrazona]|uniref:uncharacterized protein LOC122342412 n=1 Tax=Puntigrus tetrazona TaxID=1606681 RepID=UPI001C8902D9|nr:uncharacterized protein LOC122342412 [Puntigrus tetrazona]XP_043092118.1 uncharacterized protein LOC122342412 [Puntigrus tetrazona]XP_043092119.1 uncharacterized protein LOC122342412 [Puntigrus tetrazona]
MVLLPALLLLWVAPFSSCTDRLRTKFYLQEPQTQINDAVSACRHNYTDLVTIYDREENMTEAKILINGSDCSWIGANGCTWSNGDPVRFINFSRNSVEKCCGALTTGREWECLNCSSEMYFMCYKEGNRTLIPENKTWFEAQLYCKNNQSDLVSIRNETENEQAKEALNGTNFVWIGLQYNYKIVWFHDGTFDYKQDAKACFTFLQNRPTKPCNASLLSNCAPLCYKKLIYVSRGNMSWEDAFTHCSSLKKRPGLLRIESEDDQIETERELKRQKISGPVWIGLRQSRLFGFWIWSNGLQLGPWTNWKEENFPEHQTSQHCGAMENMNGQYKWSDKDCRSTFRALCEVN